MKQGFRICYGWMLALGLVACNSSIVPANTPIPSSAMTSDLDMPSPDIFITPAQSGRVVSVSNGQVIAVVNPGVSMQWQVSFSEEVLELLTPQENMREPGSSGWLFRAKASGKTDLLLTSIPRACSSNTPCPPMSAKFVFTIQVE